MISVPAEKIPYITAVCFLLCFASVCRGEDILKLKNGKTVSGKITGESSSIVQIKVYGAVIPYFRDEIVEIKRGTKRTGESAEAPEAMNGSWELRKAVRSARQHIKNREYKEAFLILETVRLKHPEDPDLNAALGAVCMGEKQYASAVRCFEKAVSGGRADPSNLRDLGKAYFMAGDIDSAEKTLLKLVSSGEEKKAKTYLYLGRIYLEKEEYDKALDYLRQSADMEDIPSPEAVHFTGWAYYHLNDYKKAVVFWERAINAGYPSSSTYFTIGQACLESGDLEKAESYFKKSLRLPGADKCAVYERLGQVYLRGKNSEKAAEYFRKASNFSPKTSGFFSTDITR